MIGEFVGTVLFMIFALGGTKSVFCHDPSACESKADLLSVALIPSNSLTGQTAAGEEGTTVATVNTSIL